jgi:ATP synthase protein I
VNEPTATKADPPKRRSDGEVTFATRVGAAEGRKIEARRRPTQVWSGLGLMGVVGWSVVTPSLLGAALGVWLDRLRPGTHSWTLALLVAGIAVGCASAWYWIEKETAALRKGTP